MSKFHHIGVFVKDTDAGVAHLSSIIDVVQIGDEIFDENLKVKIVFMRDKQGVIYELVAPYGSKSPVNGVLTSGKNILNHVAYTSNQFDSEVVRLRDSGCIPLGKPKSAKAFDGARVIFFLVPLGFIFELIEKV